MRPGGQRLTPEQNALVSGCISLFVVATSVIRETEDTFAFSQIIEM